MSGSYSACSASHWLARVSSASSGWPARALACTPQKKRRTSSCEGLNMAASVAPPCAPSTRWGHLAARLRGGEEVEVDPAIGLQHRVQEQLAVAALGGRRRDRLRSAAG